ncbi:MAG: hypothetical protein ACREV0_13155 [Burkholderiales bacterium]
MLPRLQGEGTGREKLTLLSPTEHKTVQARILAYAREVGWTYVPRSQAEARRGFDPDGSAPEEQARTASLYFGDLLHAKVREFNPKYKEAEGALIGEFQRLHANIAGNRDFLANLRNQGKFFCAKDNRELDLTLIDYADLTRSATNGATFMRSPRSFTFTTVIMAHVRMWCFSSTASRCS